MLKREMVKRGWKAMGMKMGIAAAAVIIGLAAVPGTAEAKMENGSFVSIAGGAVDSITVNGVTVEALYAPYGPGTDTDTTYSCAAFVKRFYSQVYGRDVYNLNTTTSTPLIDQGSFSKTNSPKVGDILRDDKSVHWAIVKEVNGDTITVIQQNAWNGAYDKAWVGATVDVDDSRYTFFRWSGNEGENSQTDTTHDFSFNYHSLERYDTNAVIHTKVNNPEKLHVQTVGCYIYDGNGNLIKRHEESCSRDEKRFNIWYDFNGELGVTLTPGTEYSYQFYVIYDGTEYQGAKESFTTTGTAPAAETDDTDLMSKDCGPAPSLEYGKEGWMSLQELARSSEQVLYDRMWEPENEDGNKKISLELDEERLNELSNKIVEDLKNDSKAKEILGSNIDNLDTTSASDTTNTDSSITYSIYLNKSDIVTYEFNLYDGSSNYSIAFNNGDEKSIVLTQDDEEVLKGIITNNNGGMTIDLSSNNTNVGTLSINNNNINFTMIIEESSNTTLNAIITSDNSNDVITTTLSMNIASNGTTIDILEVNDTKQITTGTADFSNINTTNNISVNSLTEEDITNIENNLMIILYNYFGLNLGI